MSDLPTKHADVNITELTDEEPSETTDPNGQEQKNNMLRTMSARSTLGKIQRDNKARY